MFDPPAPRWSQALSSNPARSGMKLVSHMLRPGRTGMNSPSPLKYLAAPCAFGKGVAVVEYEGFVVKQVEHEREIVGGGKARALAPARIEVLVAGVERQREQALGSPFEAVLAAVAGLDRGVAVTGQHVDDLFEQMLLRRRLRARCEIEHEDRDEVAAALEVHEAAIDAEARPRRGRDREQVDAEILGDRHAFVRRPGGIGVEQHLGMLHVGHRLIHGSPRQSLGRRAILSPLSISFSNFVASCRVAGCADQGQWQ